MLSILICSLANRTAKLEELLSVLRNQVNSSVEVLVETDNGEMSVGAKRNVLLAKAKRKYLSFIDDDDIVSANYVPLILNAITTGVGKYGDLHCVGMCGYITSNGIPSWQFRHSVTCNNWSKDKKNRIYFRYPNHLNPIKSQIAKAIGFPEINIGEDRSFSDKIKPYLANEIFIEQPIYFYRR